MTDLQNASDAIDDAVAKRVGINRTDLRCAAYLALHGPMTASELASIAGLTPGALTIAVDRLERDGLARRTRHPTDRRRVLVEATERTCTLGESMWSQMATQARRQLQAYTNEQLELINRFLHQQLALHAEQMRRVQQPGSNQTDRPTSHR